MKKHIVISVLTFIAVVFCYSHASACEFDTDCSVGSKCLKASGSLYGVCVGGISPGNKNDSEPATDMNRTYGNTCSFDTDCGPGYKCYKKGGIDGTCLKR